MCQSLRVYVAPIGDKSIIGLDILKPLWANIDLRTNEITIDVETLHVNIGIQYKKSCGSPKFN